MAFEALETSRFGGRPVRLYEFRRQSLVWRYSGSGADVVAGGNTYQGATIKRSEIEQTAQREKNKLTITAAYLLSPDAGAYPVTQPLGDNWRPYTPADTISVVCLAAHIGDSGPPAVEWSGIVSQVAYTDTELTLTCEPGQAIGQARNQGARWQRGCWKTVYSTGLRGCNLSAAPIPIEATLTAVAGSDVTAPEFAGPPRALVGGTVDWQTPDLVQHSASITAHTGSTITLDDVTGLEIGSAVTANTIALWVDATLAGVAGLVVSASEFAGAPLALDGGWVEWTRGDGLVELRSITGHSGEDVTLLYGAQDLATGLDVRAIPGCQQSWAACAARGNTINYGGAIYKPGRDPTQEPLA